MRNILACIDFSDVSPLVLETATAMAKAFHSNLILLHAAPVMVPVGDALVMPVPLNQADLDTLRDRLVALGRPAAAQGLGCEAVVVEGPAVDVIIDEAHRRDADLIVIGSHGHGALYHLLMGGTAEGVMRRAGRQVLIVPSHTPARDPETEAKPLPSVSPAV